MAAAVVMAGLYKIRSELKQERALAERVEIIEDEIRKIDTAADETAKRVRTDLVSVLAAKVAKDADAAAPEDFDIFASDVAVNAEAVRKHLKKIDFHFNEMEGDESIVVTGLLCADGEIIDVFSWRIVAEDDWLQSFFRLPTHVSEKKRPMMAQFLTYVNAPLRWGKLVMDFDDGEIMFQLSVPSAVLKGDADEEVDRLIGNGLASAERGKDIEQEAKDGSEEEKKMPRWFAEYRWCESLRRRIRETMPDFIVF